MYQRKQYHTLLSRMQEKRRFIQVIMGPRQVGKSTLMKQVVNDLDIPFVFYPADAVPAAQLSWISDCWSAARAKMRVEGLKELILVIDEIQKINGWSDVVKKEWDSLGFIPRDAGQRPCRQFARPLRAYHPLTLVLCRNARCF